MRVLGSSAPPAELLLSDLGGCISRRCRQSGLDVANLCADLTQGRKMSATTPTKVLRFQVSMPLGGGMTGSSLGQAMPLPRLFTETHLTGKLEPGLVQASQGVSDRLGPQCCILTRIFGSDESKRREYYCFSQHRALVGLALSTSLTPSCISTASASTTTCADGGQEVLLCHGFPIWSTDLNPTQQDSGCCSIGKCHGRSMAACGRKTDQEWTSVDSPRQRRVVSLTRQCPRHVIRHGPE